MSSQSRPLAAELTELTSYQQLRLTAANSFTSVLPLICLKYEFQSPFLHTAPFTFNTFYHLCNVPGTFCLVNLRRLTYGCCYHKYAANRDIQGDTKGLREALTAVTQLKEPSRSLVINISNKLQQLQSTACSRFCV